MRWPWQRSEARASSHTDALVSAILQAATGTATADAHRHAALETAAVFYQSAFAAARVDADARITAALTPSVLALIVRNLIRHGESLHVIDVTDAGQLALVPVGSHDVRGPAREADWWYRADVWGPSGSHTRTVPSAGVLHFRYAVDPARPWRGLAPLAWAAHTGRLAGNLEARLGDEAGASVGSFISMPKNDGDPDKPDTDPNAELRADIRGADGKHLLVETTAAGHGEGMGSAPRDDWKPHRFGAESARHARRLALERRGRVSDRVRCPSLARDGRSRRHSSKRRVETVCAVVVRGPGRDPGGRAAGEAGPGVVFVQRTVCARSCRTLASARPAREARQHAACRGAGDCGALMADFFEVRGDDPRKWDRGVPIADARLAAGI